MRTLIRTAAITLAALAGASSTAWAGEKYVLLSAGTTVYTGSGQSDNDALLGRAGLTGVQSSMDTSTTGYKLFLGYQFNPNFAMEGGYVDLGSLGYNASYTGGTISVNNKTTGYNVSALGMLPVNSDLTAFGKAGFTLANIKGTGTSSTGVSVTSSDDKSSLGYGVGLIYQINPQIGLRTEWERIAPDMNLFSLGLQFKY